MTKCLLYLLLISTFECYTTCFLNITQLHYYKIRITNSRKCIEIANQNNAVRRQSWPLKLMLCFLLWYETIK